MQTDVLGRWSAQEEKDIRMLSRPDGSRMFQNLTRGNWYLIQAEGYLNNSASGQTSEMALTWNRTALPGGSVSVFNQTVQLEDFQYFFSLINCFLHSQHCLGDLLPVPRTIPLQFVFRIPLLLGLSVRSVLRLVSHHELVFSAL